jgi:O-antigen/teichoic acid export membrane protein
MSIKSLASQTLWYGLSNIVGRFLNYFLSLILIYIYRPAELAGVFQVYVIVPFLNIIFTLGLETSYFRFSKTIEKRKLFNTLTTFIVLTTLALTVLFIALDKPIVALFDLGAHVNYYYWMLTIIAVDTLCTLPFVALRNDGRPKRFATIKFLNIVVNVFFVLLFLVVLKPMSDKGTAVPRWLYNPEIGVGYFIIANLISSIATFLMLLPEWKGYKYYWDSVFIKNVMKYSAPIIVVGFGGMINDFISRLLYYRLLPQVPRLQLDHEFGVFNANYKLAVLATLFIQVFKMGAEPFFFKQSNADNAREMYARVTKIFSIICCFLFLFIALNLDALKLIISLKHKEYAEGIVIVPLLTLANIFLGIYYNLAVWYKNTDNTLKGAVITLLGVLVTIVCNVLLVPSMHYLGAAWATFICYAFMLVVSYFWGQKVYPIPYDVPRIALYFAVALGFFGLYKLLVQQLDTTAWYVGAMAFVICCVMLGTLVLKIDNDELIQRLRRKAFRR